MSVQEMINTPGYYYSLAYWLAAFIVDPGCKTVCDTSGISGGDRGIYGSYGRGEDQFVPSVYAGFSFPVFDLYLPVLSVFTC